MSNANTALLLTAPGTSAIAVIRMRGPDVEAFLTRHFHAALRANAPIHGKLFDGHTELDDPVVIWNPQRQSADICTHGGRWVVHSVIELAKREGFDLVSSDAPLPAVAVDTDDIIEQEILQYLPLARTGEAIQTLLNQREAWRNLQSEISGPISQVSNLLSDQSLHWLLHPPRIAIIGIPNAGKSTLANALFGREHSIVADMPGTTRDYIEEFANLSGLPVRLIDTPGLRVSGDEIESAAIALSLKEVESADLKILLLDPAQDDARQADLAAKFPDALPVSTKCDIHRVDRGPAISAVTGEGLAELDLTIRRRFGCEFLPHTRPCVWTQRQRELLHLG